MKRLEGLLVLLPALTGCGTPTLESTLADVVEETGLTYASCGAYRITQDECGPDATTPPAEVQCLIDAVAACRPAHLTLTRGTLEGDPIDTAYVVRPEGTGCSVITIVDTRADQFGGQSLTTSQCQTFTRVDGCPWVTTSGCAAM